MDEYSLHIRDFNCFLLQLEASALKFRSHILNGLKEAFDGIRIKSIRHFFNCQGRASLSWMIVYFFDAL